MKYCFYCGNEIQQEGGFCPYCGSFIQTAPVSQHPVPQPSVQALPKVSAGTKVKGFIGMGLGINAFIFGIFAAVMGHLCILIVSSDPYSYSSLGTALIYSIFWGLSAIAGGIPGKILCKKSISEGFVTKYTGRGNAFSTIAIILGSVGFILGIACLVIALG